MCRPTIIKTRALDSSSKVCKLRYNLVWLIVQVAQLSQRDRAAWWVSNGQKWKTGTERNIYGQYRSTLGCTVEALRAIIGSKSATSLQRGPVNPKFQVEGVAPHQPFSFSEN